MGQYQSHIRNDTLLVKEIRSNGLKQNLVFYEPPFPETGGYMQRGQRMMSYTDQLENTEKDEYENTDHNVLFLCDPKLKITCDDVYTEKELFCNSIKEEILRNYYACAGRNDHTLMHLHKSVELTISNKVKESVEKIAQYEKQINELKQQINNEKNTILNDDEIQNALKNTNFDVPFYLKVADWWKNRM